MATNLTVEQVVDIYYSIIKIYLPNGVSLDTIKRLYNPETPLSTEELYIKSTVDFEIHSNLKKIKTKFVAEVFIKSGGTLSNKNLASLVDYAYQLDHVIPRVSASTVQRYLTDKSLDKMLSPEDYKFLKEHIKLNIELGRSKGGFNYSLKNDALANDEGKFTGSKAKVIEVVLSEDFKRVIEEEAKLFIDGNTLEEIAAKLEERLGMTISPVSIKKNITTVLKQFNQEMYEQVRAKLAKQHEDNRRSKLDEIIEIYHLYIDERYTYSQIASLFGVNTSTISRKLNQEIRSLHEEFPDEITTEMLEAIDERKLQNQLSNVGARR